MGSLKRFLVTGCITLSVLSIFELGYTIFVLAKHLEDFSAFNLFITSFINFSIVFFGVTLIIGVIKSNCEILLISLIYLIVEIIRSTLNYFYGSWESDSDFYEKVFVAVDSGKLKLLC